MAPSVQSRKARKAANQLRKQHKKRTRLQNHRENTSTSTPVPSIMACTPTPTVPPNKDLEALKALTSTLADFRSTITCKVCFRLLYEPFTNSCGHTFCYSCLNQWFASNTTHKRKTCPDCRAVINHQPAPSYLIRELTQKFVQQPELLDEGETLEQHEQHRIEEAGILERDKLNTDTFVGGLFKGLFNHSTNRGPLTDLADGVFRCPDCTWELEDGQCTNCGWEDADYDDEEDDDDEEEVDFDMEMNPAHFDYEPGFNGLLDSDIDFDFDGMGDDFGTFSDDDGTRRQLARDRRRAQLRLRQIELLADIEAEQNSIHSGSEIEESSNDEDEEEEDEEEMRDFIDDDAHTTIDLTSTPGPEPQPEARGSRRRQYLIIDEEDDDDDDDDDGGDDETLHNGCSSQPRASSTATSSNNSDSEDHEDPEEDVIPTSMSGLTTLGSVTSDSDSRSDDDLEDESTQDDELGDDCDDSDASTDDSVPISRRARQIEAAQRSLADTAARVNQPIYLG